MNFKFLVKNVFDTTMKLCDWLNFNKRNAASYEEILHKYAQKNMIGHFYMSNHLYFLQNMHRLDFHLFKNIHMSIWVFAPQILRNK